MGAIIAGVVVSVGVVVTVVILVLLVLILCKKTDIFIRKIPNTRQTLHLDTLLCSPGTSTKGLIPGDNPIYMSSADMNAVSPSSLPSPTHSTTTPPSRATETTPIDDLIPEEEDIGDTGEIGDSGEMREEVEMVFDDSVYDSSYTCSTTPGKLDPYGNYGDKTITRVACVAPPPHLFDDRKYAEWSPDSDDVDSDCQSEYYM